MAGRPYRVGQGPRTTGRKCRHDCSFGRILALPTAWRAVALRALPGSMQRYAMGRRAKERPFERLDRVDHLCAIGMRFLLVNYEYPPIGAGAANATRHIAQCLLAQGHHVGVLTAAFGDLRGWSEDHGLSIYRCRCLRKSPERSNIVEMTSFMV